MGTCTATLILQAMTRKVQVHVSNGFKTRHYFLAVDAPLSDCLQQYTPGSWHTFRHEMGHSPCALSHTEMHTCHTRPVEIHTGWPLVTSSLLELYPDKILEPMSHVYIFQMVCVTVEYGTDWFRKEAKTRDIDFHPYLPISSFMSQLANEFGPAIGKVQQYIPAIPKGIREHSVSVISSTTLAMLRRRREFV